MLDQIMAQLPEEGEEPPAEVAGAEVTTEAMDSMLNAEEPETTMPDEGLMMQLFQVVYGVDYDPASPQDQQRMAEIQSVLASDPTMSEGLMSGDVSMTEKWKIGFQSGYDFVQKDWTYTNVSIYRDMNCWEARFTWVPFGFQRSYNIQVNMKSSLLRDLKLQRRRSWYDY